MTVSETSAARSEKTEVVHGSENVIKRELRFFSKAKSRIDTCMDHTRPSLALDIESIKKSFLEAKKRNVKLRYLTEITNTNVPYCKQLTSIVSELRHLDEIRGNFMISETEYLAPTITYKEKKIASLAIYSSVRDTVEHQQYLFDTLWSKSVSAQRRFQEIEEGETTTRFQTKLIQDPNVIVQEISRLSANSNDLRSCLTSGGLRYSYEHFFELKKKLLQRQQEGTHKGIRYITNIDKDNAKLAKIFVDAGFQIRHIKNLPPMSFGLSDTEIAATIEKMEGGRMVQSLLLSNEPAYIQHFSSIFDELWNQGINADDRLRNLEEGSDLAEIEIIQNPREGISRAWNYVRNSKHEVLCIFATANAFWRQTRLGLLELLNEATERRAVDVRILIPAGERLKDTLIQAARICPKVDFRVAEESLQTRITIVLVDKKNCIIIELKDDTKESSFFAAGLATYSNSKSIISSYASIFESLWKQNELYEQLKTHAKMQEEFINVAAHELRTPIQPILGLTELLRIQIKDVNQRKLLDIAIRNARRLQRLTEDILDVTKIETKSLVLKKELFDLNEVIIDEISDANNQISKGNKVNRLDIKLEPKGHRHEPTLIKADRERIGQVVSNLLSNAIKFTHEGSISVIIDKSKSANEVVVSIKDTGSGLDPDILSRLFSKFATKSDKGTGLGLFISKSIIEANGGRIFAENNVSGKGATFTFILPISD